MRLIKLDDYQSWLIVIGGATVLVDPWLTDSFAFAQGRWLFHRDRTGTEHTSVEELPAIDLVLVTAHFSDHLNPATLNKLGLSTRLAGSKAAIKKLRKLGFTNTTTLRRGDEIRVGDGSITGIAPGFPYSRNSIGLLFREAPTRRSAYLETHVVARRRAPRADALVTTVESVRLLGLQLGMDADRTIQATERVGAQYVIPTGDRPGSGQGLLSRILRVRGTIDEFGTALQRSGSPAEMARLGTGESIELR
jgi:L-ascorbate metabolism protein UlaG (beta-lactamase superfamily)